MKIGIGLPNTVPGTPGGLLVDWAMRAEERGFAGLATIDRIVYPSHDTNDLGMTELYLDPTVASLDQVDRLADLVL
jgi:hypothetical protein